MLSNSLYKERDIILERSFLFFSAKYIMMLGILALASFSFSYDDDCDNMNPADYGSVTKPVMATPHTSILATAETFAIINGTTGGVTITVLTSDSLNGAAVNPDDITLAENSILDPNGAATTALALNADGTITVGANTPAGDYAVDYTICDNLNPANCSSVTETVTVASNTVTAKNDINNTLYETAVKGDASVNDPDAEGDKQTFTLDNANGGMDMADGTVTMNANGVYTYFPAPGFIGGTTFNYTVCDDGTPVLCEAATVYLEVLPPVSVEQTPIIANPDANTLEAGQTGKGKVIYNDLDSDGRGLEITTPLTAVTVTGTDRAGNPVADAGTLTLGRKGDYVFIPKSNFMGRVNHNYTVCTSDGTQCDNTILTMEVIPDTGNSTFANDDAAITDRGVKVSDNILLNDADVESDIQTVNSFRYDSDGDGKADEAVTWGVPSPIGGFDNSGAFIPDAGSLIIAADGSYTFLPVTSFVGHVAVSYNACDDVAPVSACDNATLIINIMDVSRDYGDAPEIYPEVWHRAISDDDGNRILDGTTTDIWLGTDTDFEEEQSWAGDARSDQYDDALDFGSAEGQFPDMMIPGQTYDIDVILNSAQPDLVYYGFWIDWDEDGVYDDFRSGSANTASPVMTTVTVTAPSSVGKRVNVRLRADDSAFAAGDFRGGRTNGEVEDYQNLISLPVELHSFEGKAMDCRVRLNWISETEENFDRYEIEWSADGNTWEVIDEINGQGGIISQYYQYLHKEAIEKNYYRLRMVDIDGTAEYSNLIIIRTYCATGSELYPNPVTPDYGIISIKFRSDIEMNDLVTITDVLGRTMKREELLFSGRTLELDISGLPGGIYNLKFENSGISKVFVVTE